MSDSPASSASDIEKSGVVETRTEHVEHDHEKHYNTNLRIDGDDEDHEHEPPVSFAGLQDNNGQPLIDADDIQALHESASNGILVDRLADSCVSLWLCTSVHLWRHWWCRQVDLVCE